MRANLHLLTKDGTILMKKFWLFQTKLNFYDAFFRGECSAHNSDLYFSDGFRACLSMSDLARL